ncbi:hypothetical protein [Tenacibaculum halocynthiae]
MLKNISNLGSTLNKTEQQSINGGRPLCDLCIDSRYCIGDPRCED